jgi:hypothetical protein
MALLVEVDVCASRRHVTRNSAKPVIPVKPVTNRIPIGVFEVMGRASGDGRDAELGTVWEVTIPRVE